MLTNKIFELDFLSFHFEAWHRMVFTFSGVGVRCVCIVSGWVGNTRQLWIDIKLVSARFFCTEPSVWTDIRLQEDTFLCMRGHYTLYKWKENAIYVSSGENGCFKLFSLKPFLLWIQTIFLLLSLQSRCPCFSIIYLLKYLKGIFPTTLIVLHPYNAIGRKKKTNIFIISISPFCTKLAFITTLPLYGRMVALVGVRTMDVAKNGKFIEFRKFWFP